MINKVSLTSLLILFSLNSIHAQNSKPSAEKGFSIGLGLGLSRPGIEKSDWIQSGINYSDSLNGIKTSFSPQFLLILSYYFKAGENIALRPTLTCGFGSGDIIIYERKQADEKLKIFYMPYSLSLPFLIKLPSTQNRFYTMVAPVATICIGEDKKTKDKFKVNSFDAGFDTGFGYDFPVNKIIVTPEIKYSMGLLNLKKDLNNFYTNTIDKVNRQVISLSIHIRNNQNN